MEKLFHLRTTDIDQQKLFHHGLADLVVAAIIILSAFQASLKKPFWATRLPDPPSRGPVTWLRYGYQATKAEQRHLLSWGEFVGGTPSGADCQTYGIMDLNLNSEIHLRVIQRKVKKRPRPVRLIRASDFGFLSDLGFRPSNFHSCP
ncbi:MAG: hypothetical protein NTW03_12830 [Verrucomicrobia bacterium]|nr:hypothetical protein [Verrucomicrobiota bacterium]